MKLRTLLFGAMTLLFSINSPMKAVIKTTETTQKSVVVEINYGGLKPARQAEVNWQEGLSALMALQQSAKVETKPAGPYKIVTAVDSIAGSRGVMAWYYKINRIPAKVMAMNYIALPGDTITWNFTKDVCSETVDKKTK